MRLVLFLQVPGQVGLHFFFLQDVTGTNIVQKSNNKHRRKQKRQRQRHEHEHARDSHGSSI
jgi:hypothetical protein